MDILNGDELRSHLESAPDESLSLIVRVAPRHLEHPSTLLALKRPGSLQTFGTTQNDPFLVQFSERFLPVVTEHYMVRTAELSDEARRELQTGLDAAGEIMAIGAPVWTPIRTSEAFAADIWQRCFGEALHHAHGGLSSPETLARSIARASFQDAVHEVADPLEPRLYDKLLRRIRELRGEAPLPHLQLDPTEDDPQRQRHGPSF